MLTKELGEVCESASEGVAASQASHFVVANEFRGQLVEQHPLLRWHDRSPVGGLAHPHLQKRLGIAPLRGVRILPEHGLSLVSRLVRRLPPLPLL
jgi:hypothetical protein